MFEFSIRKVTLTGPGAREKATIPHLSGNKLINELGVGTGLTVPTILCRDNLFDGPALEFDCAIMETFVLLDLFLQVLCVSPVLASQPLLIRYSCHYFAQRIRLERVRLVLKYKRKRYSTGI
ncbi:hypothetical protein AVEN_234032-1 [Araneus ventricosus]|uniref:Uncharacterized protein n=1 Tax=Araneus ventricosus TaxID=182803 RepID=A0A4Y2FJZ7_ARAVE|nr:hypothetical protein AVEN_234032-1 [Araneus ventricosus]